MDVWKKYDFIYKMKSYILWCISECSFEFFITKVDKPFIAKKKQGYLIKFSYFLNYEFFAICSLVLFYREFPFINVVKNIWSYLKKKTMLTFINPLCVYLGKN